MHVLIAPFMLLGGFFAPLSEVPSFAEPIEYLSMYKYGYEGLAYAQFYKGFNTSGTF